MTKNKFRLNTIKVIEIAIFIAISVLLSIEAYAKIDTNRQNTFKDVDANAYYADSVNSLAAMGYLNGYGDGTFGVNDPITKTQAILLLARISGEYDENYILTYSNQQGYKTWDYGIKNWAIDNGYETSSTIQGYATRLDIARYTVKILNIPTNIPMSTNEIFIDTTNIYVNTLYLNGIVKGVGSTELRYSPNNNISRADTCVIMHRLLGAEFMQPEKTPGSSLYITKGIDFKSIWKNMLDNNLTTHVVKVNQSFNSKDEINNICSQGIRDVYNALSEKPLYEGYFDLFTGKYTYTDYLSHLGDVEITLEMKVKPGENEYVNEIAFVEQSLKKTLDDLYNSKKLNKFMNDKDRALVISKLVCDYLRYDYNYNNYTAYDALTTRKAVCSGYSAICTYLMQLDGIEAKTVTGVTKSGAHEWVMVIDRQGNIAYIDPTWMDTNKIGKYNTEWFWVSKSFLESNDNWRVFD